ncbi:MAG: HIT family protein [Nanoarchaeota archaeon]|nr:HIT family protein [Nanoarchaeota archaeon]
MAHCDICSILENKDSFKFIYEDEDCFAILHESPSVEGHALVIPKKHTTILEELDDRIIEKLFSIANKVSSALFEIAGAHGTNIMVNNGSDAGQELPHVVINVLPRKENDSLNLEWPAKKASDTELKTVLSLITGVSYLFSDRPKPEAKALPEERKQGPIEKAPDDYMVKGLLRVP